MLARLNDNLGFLHPLKTMGDLHRDFYNLFDDLNEGWNYYRSSHPRLTVEDRGENVVAMAFLPGYEAKQLDVEVVGDFLTIRAERKEPELKEGGKYLHRERSFGIFEETVRLPARVKNQKSKAGYKNGILEVTMPKDESEKPCNIKIS